MAHNNSRGESMKKRREQEQLLLPPLKELDEKKFKCPKCGANIGSQVINWLHELTGIPISKLKDPKEINWMLQIAERTMMIAGIEINESVITEKALQHVEKLLSTRLTEEEREKYEQKIEDLKKQMEQQMKHEKELNEKERERLNERYEKLEKEYNELRAKVKHVPAIAGSEQQKSILTRLESISRGNQDEFQLVGESTTLGEDICSRIVENNQEIGKIIIEVKKTGVWQNKFIEQIRDYMDKYNTAYGILATTTMPANALNNALYITKDSIWVVREDLIEYAYRAMREIIVEIYKQKLSEKQGTEAMKLLREKVLSDATQGKFSIIISRADRIETITKQLQNSTEKNCESIREETREIRNEINQWIDELKGIIQQVKEAKVS